MPTVSLSPAPLSAPRRSLLQRRVRWIVTATIAYNVAEAIAASRAASSAALIGFGLDSPLARPAAPPDSRRAWGWARSG